MIAGGIWALSPEEALILLGLAGAAAGLGKAAADALRGDEPEEGEPVPVRVGPDRSNPDRSGPDRSGPDRSGPDRSHLDRPHLDWPHLDGPRRGGPLDDRRRDRARNGSGDLSA